MQTHTIRDGATTYQRISKQAARRRFHNGENFYIIACKMRPGYPFSMGMWVDPIYRYNEYCSQYWLSNHTKDDAFEQLCRDFASYNCNYECGYYPAFYIES
jgi:hypothetical protein